MADPTPLQRLLVRRGLDCNAAASRLTAFARRSRDIRDRVTVSGGYLNKIANGFPPSLRLARVILRWAKERGGVRLTLDDLGLRE
jgi:hypothetical protein